MKRRCQEGVGNNVRHAQILSYDEDDLMWRNSILGVDDPVKLLKMLVFVLGMSCALRAGKEHRSLRSIGFNSSDVTAS